MESKFREISDPKSWEKYFKSLLKLHFGQSCVFDIPDEHGGDWGIECYTASGEIYQCYFPTDKPTTSKLYEAQRDKINSDLIKLTDKNAQIFSEIFSSRNIKIKRWILATPIFNTKMLSKYTAKKSQEIRELGLDFIDNDFQIMVQTDEDFEYEKQKLLDCHTYIKVEVEEVSEQDLASWINENVGFMNDLYPKLCKLTDNDIDKINHHKQEISRLYLNFQNTLDVYSNEFPQLHVALIDCINSRKKHLKNRISLLGKKAPPALMEENLERLESDLKSIFPRMLGGHREELCWGAISSWLIECPLRF
jgi:hypothetical protein